jgi:hypothetical protein
MDDIISVARIEVLPEDMEYVRPGLLQSATPDSAVSVFLCGKCDDVHVIITSRDKLHQIGFNLTPKQLEDFVALLHNPPPKINPKFEGRIEIWP